MRTNKQIDAIADLFLGGASKTKAMIAGGYSPRSAQSNTNRIFPRGSYRYKRFVHGLFIFGWNKAKAARYAGYSPRWAGANTTRLMKHPVVQAELLSARRALHPENYPAQECALGND